MYLGIHIGGTKTQLGVATAAGEELSEHTSSKTALIEVLHGHLHLELADTPHEVGPGDWVRG